MLHFLRENFLVEDMLGRRIVPFAVDNKCRHVIKGMITILSGLAKPKKHMLSFSVDIAYIDDETISYRNIVLIDVKCIVLPEGKQQVP